MNFTADKFTAWTNDLKAIWNGNSDQIWEKSFFQEGGQTLGNVPKGFVGFLPFNDIQSLTKNGPEQLKVSLP